MRATADAELADDAFRAAPSPASPPNPYRPVPFAEWHTRPAHAWVIRGLLRRSEAMLIFGQPGSKKSFIALDVLVRVALGRDVWGRFGTDPAGGTVLYCLSEGEAGMADRVRAWIGDSADGPAVDRRVYLLDRCPKLLDDEHVAWFIAALAAACPNPLLVVFDTYSACRGAGDENDNAVMDQVFAAVRRIRQELGCAVIAVHHARKGGDELRGATATKAAFDVVGSVKPRGRTGARLTFATEGGGKLKDIADPGEIEFEFDQVDLGEDPSDPDGPHRSSLRVRSAHPVSAAPSDAPVQAPDGGRISRYQHAMLLHFSSVEAGELETRKELVRVAKRAASDPVQDNTLRRHVTDLAKRGALEKRGQGPSTRYAVSAGWSEFVEALPPIEGASRSA